MEGPLPVPLRPGRGPIQDCARCARMCMHACNHEHERARAHTHTHKCTPARVHRTRGDLAQLSGWPGRHLGGRRARAYGLPLEWHPATRVAPPKRCLACLCLHPSPTPASPRITRTRTHTPHALRPPCTAPYRKLHHIPQCERARHRAPHSTLHRTAHSTAAQRALHHPPLRTTVDPFGPRFWHAAAYAC